jgi:D-glycero-D-manno-heptose 1,7-bisphosphate phosphatase
VVGAAAFLDRDGVISANVLREGRPVAPTRLEELRILPGVEEAVAKLKSAGFKIIVVTNQPDIATGRSNWEIVGAMHRELRLRLPVDDIKVCPHAKEDDCSCRKPKPGMLLAAAAEHGISLKQSFMIGDRISDIEAGLAAGCGLTALIDYGYETTGSRLPDIIAASLLEAVNSIMSRNWPAGAKHGLSEHRSTAHQDFRGRGRSQEHS